ncbi:MAG: DUF2809 domain-containing protein [Bacteroidota bacterium]
MVLVVIILGINSRGDFISMLVPYFMGDILYALMMFFLLGFLFPTLQAVPLFILSFGICVGVECAQLYRADWIVEFRSHKLVALVLGRSFRWLDFISYFAGSLMGLGIEKIIQKFRPDLYRTSV